MSEEVNYKTEKKADMSTLTEKAIQRYWDEIVLQNMDVKEEKKAETEPGCEECCDEEDCADCSRSGHAEKESIWESCVREIREELKAIETQFVRLRHLQEIMLILMDEYDLELQTAEMVAGEIEEVLKRCGR